ncbi:MAG: hypothetical protein A3F11_07030 [Gammaproteobacteria bacterium RIFCSPHIGHO2_12_FULL_37_14]|nr:MAG: hypothetical protein A3F11_07030 [Gammaproteobacteria bacterium RIFCSPHIGHO2_12_FULL_37_14]
MRRIKKIKKVKKCITMLYSKIMSVLFLVLASQASFADPIIPVSTNDQTSSGSSYAQTILTIFQQEIIPIVLIFGAITILWISISSVVSGVKEARELRKFEPLKEAIIISATAIVVGGSILYLLNQVRTYSF